MHILLDGIQGRPPDGALTAKSDFTGVTLTTRKLQDRSTVSVDLYIKRKPIYKKDKSAHSPLHILSSVLCETLKMHI